MVKVGDFGMSRYAESWRREGGEGSLERTLTPGEQGASKNQGQQGGSTKGRGSLLRH